MAEPLWEETQQCRACGSRSLKRAASFGEVPLADKLRLRPEREDPAPKAPLDILFCEGCSLSQLSVSVSPPVLFGADYHYYTSVSPALSRHFEESAQRIIAAYGVGRGATVIEAGSNDGTMLGHFKRAGASVLGFDPACGPARAAIERGINTRADYFGRDAARELSESGVRADIFLANNVLAHVPDLTGFVESVASVLKPEGTAVIEVPYLADLVIEREFDTIYHQHLFYFSVTSLERLFGSAGLRIDRVERIPIHGGSLRLFVNHGRGSGESAVTLVENERSRGWDRFEFVRGIGAAAEAVRRDLAALIRMLRGDGKSVVAYGAAAKATTLLAWCGLDAEQLSYVADLNPRKHGLFMPGTDLEIVRTDAIRERRPDYVLILAWNFADEIMDQLADYRQAGGSFIVPLPRTQVV